jgi:hypothetical protein
MIKTKELKKSYLSLSKDKRVNVSHIGIYIALLYLWLRNKGINPTYITRRKVMQLAHIRSIATYHKCIRQLQEFGYVHYIPSYNRFSGSQVYIIFGR